MKTYYELIINDNLQKSLNPFETKKQALDLIASWKADGRLKENDKVVIRTTIVIEDEVTLWF